MAQKKLIIVSNRLPVQIKKTKGGWDISPTSGGLVSALAGVKKELDFTWVGWAGAEVPKNQQTEVHEKFVSDLRYHPVFLTEKEIDHFYNNFCNRVIWPLFHYSPDRVDFNLPHWDEYRKVNEQFCQTILPLCDDDTIVWVHDYHLFLLPAMLRAKKPNIRIGFFLHIPFPSSEIYRLLPVRKELLEGLLGSDLIGFQTYDYARHFGSSCVRLLGLECGPNQIELEDRTVSIGSYPIGINPEVFLEGLENPKTIEKREALKKTYEGRKVILGIDRADYSKGLTQKLKAFELFLEKHPEWQKKVVLVQVAIPSRTHVPEYKRLKYETDKCVGQINGRFGTPESIPVHYIAKGIPFPDLCALYQRADVMLITSVRDGMNLVSLEYAACQKEGAGVLVLSEFAGSAHSLGDAVFCNPWDLENVAEAIQTALTMEKEERERRARSSFLYVRDFNALAWARRFVRDLRKEKPNKTAFAQDLKSRFITLKKAYTGSAQRIIVVDYDGTLVPLTKDPQQASPPAELKDLLKNLSENKKNCVYLVSGRPQDTLERWFGEMRVGLSAEHGMFLRSRSTGSWKQMQPSNDAWMDIVHPILHNFVSRTPGAFIERKKSTLVWHYRNADRRFGLWQAHELMAHLEQVLANMPVQVLHGNHIVEIRQQGVDKGTVVREILERHESTHPLVLCLGNDRTDEDMFQALPAEAWSCHIGGKQTQASYYLENHEEALEILGELASIG